MTKRRIESVLGVKSHKPDGKSHDSLVFRPVFQNLYTA
jgi:hypothetical protein